MKYIHILIIIILFSYACSNKAVKNTTNIELQKENSLPIQDTSISGLREYVLQDSFLLENILDYCNSDYCSKSDYYLLNFFTSSISKEYYFLFINSFEDYDSLTSKKIDAFVLLDGKIFMFNSNNNASLFVATNNYQQFHYQEYWPCEGGGSFYLIYGAKNQFSWIIRKEVGE